MRRWAVFAVGFTAGFAVELAALSGWVFYAHRRHVLRIRGWRR